MYEALYQYLYHSADLSNDDFRTILPFLEIRHFAKGVKLTEIGEQEKYVNFVVSGLVRKFFYKQAEEMTTQIAQENHLISSSVSFLQGTSSKYVIETLEPTTVISISTESMEIIYGMSAKMERMGRLVITNWLLQKESWHIDTVLLKPKERFFKFITENPELLKRVPQKHLASYLNMAAETFSRYKHLIRAVQ